MTTNMVPKSSQKRLFNPFLVHFQARKRSKWSTTIVFLIFIRPISKKGSQRSHMPIIEQISRYMFLGTFSGPMVKMPKKYCFHHFHPKNISKQGSHAYVWPNLKKYVFWSQKRIFDPFGLIFGPKNGQKGQKILFSSFSSKDHFQTGITHLCLTKSEEICFSVPKDIFDPFGHIFRPKKGENSLQISL